MFSQADVRHCILFLNSYESHLAVVFSVRFGQEHSLGLEI